MFTSFPGPDAPSSQPTQALDDVSPRRRIGGVVLNEHGEVVPHWPDDRPLPDRWSISRRLVAMDADVTFAPSTGMDVESAFECLPRGLQRRRHMVETDLTNSNDHFTRAQAMTLCEVLAREIQNVGDLAAAGHVPWDSQTADAATLQAACKSARDYLAGFSDSARRMMGGSPAAASNGVGAAGDRASVSDADAAYDAHSRMVADIGSAWRTGGFAAPAPAAAPAWGSSSFGGAAVSDRDRAEDAYDPMRADIGSAWRSGR